MNINSSHWNYHHISELTLTGATFKHWYCSIKARSAAVLHTAEEKLHECNFALCLLGTPCSFNIRSQCISTSAFWKVPHTWLLDNGKWFERSGKTNKWIFVTWRKRFLSSAVVLHATAYKQKFGTKAANPSQQHVLYNENLQSNLLLI